jgi:activating signal cointegrator complex subunit 3
VLEAIVSRTRFISRHVEAENRRQSPTLAIEEKSPETTRIIGLSTALANPFDLANWIGINTESHGPSSKRGLYNFRSSVRPVPMEVHIQGFPGRHYCPRMATMNKPCFSAVKDLSPSKPSLIFVASRRQTRLTALDLISYAAGDENPKSFLSCDDDYIEAIALSLNDKVLRHTITFGIGLHHAGLTSHDREVVEKLFLEGNIQILIATATLAWGVNLPAHLVIVKGTEYFDGKLSRYVDYPVTDILQMMGRAGRPQFDTQGVAVVMCEESKKTFLKKFLYEPFPVESCLGGRMCETLNAEISTGTINSFTDAIGYLKWTFYARRVKLNPSFYGSKSSEDDDVEEFFLTVVQETAKKLQDHCCIRVDETEGTDCLLTTSPLGQAASNFYLSYQTPKQMMLGTRGLRKVLAQHVQELKREIALPKHSLLFGTAESTECVASIHKFVPEQIVTVYAIAKILYELSFTHEFAELPVRHNEEELNLELSRSLPWGYDLSKVSWWTNKTQHSGKNMLDIMASPHTKCFLLLQAFIFKAKLPISDYINDMRTVVDQIPRLLAAMQFIALDNKEAAGSFAMFSYFPLVRRIFSTGIKNGTKLSSVSNAPSITFGNFIVKKEAKKGSSQPKGSLEFDYNIEMNGFSRMNNKKSQEKGDSMGVAIVLGTLAGGYLLSQASLVVMPRQSSTRHIVMQVDWSMVDADIGKEQNHLVVLRVMHEFLSDSDFEIVISLKR